MDRVDYQPMLVQDIITWNKNSELNLSPWYQRRAVWTTPQKSYLLNTLFEQKPIPTLYFRHAVDLDEDKSMREVVDGQQRIRAILGYLGDEYTARHPQHNKKVLHKQLTPAEKRRFRETQLSGAWLLGASDADVIEVFGRLNSVAKTLNKAERRNAEFSGEFKQFCLRQATSRIELWRTLGVFTANDIARMAEVEFIADLVLNLMQGLSDYRGKAIDGLYRENEDEFGDADSVERRLTSCFSKIAAITSTAFTDTIFSRAPIFFSLILAMDASPKPIRSSKLKSALHEIDDRFNSDTPLAERPRADADFYEACRASTQRIRSREVRDRYLKKFLE